MLFRKLPQLVIKGGAVALPGKRFNLDRSLYAYGEIIDHLTTRFAKQGISKATCDWDSLKGDVGWPHPDKDRVLAAWRTYAKHYDVLGSCINHHVGPLTVRAYVLGKCWTIYDSTKDKLTSQNGGDPLTQDLSPYVEIGGRMVDGNLTGLNEPAYNTVRALVLGDLAKFGFTFSTISMDQKGAFQVIIQLHFPHSIYGAGEDWVRVRCIAPNGAELVPTAQPS